MCFMKTLTHERGEKMRVLMLLMIMLAAITFAADRVVMFGEFTSTS